MRLRNALLLAVLAACAESPTGPPALRESLPRPLSASEAQLIAASNSFAFKLFNEVGATAENSFISPLSVSMALGMTMNGAEGETLDSIRAVLGFESVALADINASYHSLIDLLHQLDRSTTFRIGNSVWFRKTFAISPTFKASVEDAFGARVTGLDFANPAAVGTINGWASDATNGRIDEVLESIEAETVMLLMNAVYFKGSWRSQFDRGATIERPFTTATGAVQSVATMAGEVNGRYAERPFARAVEMPYGNGAYTMTILLPATGMTADSLARTLSAAEWQSLVAELDASPLLEVDVRLPKFELSYARSLKDDLIALGMARAFCEECAEFGPMSADNSQVFISGVQHDTYVRVDEAGTEAAAVTTIEFGVTSAPVVPQLFVDRPFVFVIRERLSGTILFIGKMNSLPIH